ANPGKTDALADFFGRLQRPAERAIRCLPWLPPAAAPRLKSRGCICEPRIVANLAKNCLGAGRVDARDLRADAAESLHDSFVAAIDMVNAVNDGFAAGHQPREHQAGAGA